MGAPVVVNQYSIPKTTGAGGVKGTRGSTPSQFVLDYMARGDAAEKIGDSDDARIATNSALKLTDAQAGWLGRQFDNNFAVGGVLLKTVISLDHAFLVEHELVPKHSRPARRKGDYTGQIDQARLREAVAGALRDLEWRGGFGNLLSAAVIQTDTKHVHIHLAMMDLNPAAGRRQTKRAENQAKQRQVADRKIPPARGTIRAAEREAIRQSLSERLKASRKRSLARTPAIERVLAFGAKLSAAAKRLLAKRRERKQQTLRPAIQAAQPTTAPALTPAQAHI
jgi:hypothetical protein